MKNTLRTILTLAALFGLAACNLPGTGTAGPTPNATAVIETAMAYAAASLTALASQNISQPSQTPGVPGNEIPSFTPLPSLTTTPEGIRLNVSEETNCRTGPGTVYPRLGGIRPGQSAEVAGRDAASQYWYIRLPDTPTIFCWITGLYATVSGNISLIPVMTPPPTPTATMTPTPALDFAVTFVGKDMCVAYFLEFNIVNTGGILIESIRVVSKDLTTPNTFTATYDKFEDWNACLVGTIQNDLAPGESEKTNSGAGIAYDPTGHNFEATVTACSQNGLAGACLTKKIIFTP
ncbi:MAG: hypothetical protein FJZ96_05370 [Chloroflexi bacterium]|nr:hypothetical protein [Chloroflexota bacterium]